MGIWQPEPGERLLARVPVAFATGAAMRVRGMRWYRDTERNDIQDELPGWPKGPVYTAHSTGGTAARNTLKGAAMAVGVAIMAVLSSAGGNVSGSAFQDSGSDTPDEPADEIQDFPVIWAAPATIARTLPWQLDPARSDQERYRTHAIVTDRRLVIVGLPFHKKDRSIIEDEFLWEAPRSTIASVERRNFKDGWDVKIAFTDGSWCRWRVIDRNRLTRYLSEPLKLIPLESLTPEQRNTADSFTASQATDAEPPLVTHNSCGCFRVEVIALSTVDSFFGHSEINMTMDANGTELKLMEYHPEDIRA